MSFLLSLKPVYKIVLVLLIAGLAYFTYYKIENYFINKALSASSAQIKKYQAKERELYDRNNKLSTDYSELLNSYKQKNDEIADLNGSLTLASSKLNSINSRLNSIIQYRKKGLAEIEKASTDRERCVKIVEDLKELQINVSNNYCERYK